MNDEKANILNLLWILSSIKFQQNVWVDGKYFNRATCFGETVNPLEDYNFFDDIDSGAIALPILDNQKALLIFVSDLLNYGKFSVLSENDMISNYNWLLIVAKAKHVYTLLSGYWGIKYDYDSEL